MNRLVKFALAMQISLFLSYTIWEQLPGFGDFWITLILIINFAFLFLSFCFYLLLLTTEEQKKPIFHYLFLITAIFVLTYFKGWGLDSWRTFSSKVTMSSYFDGGPFCNYNLILKENNRFRFRKLCFGSESAYGNYEIKGDSIFFHFESNVISPRFDVGYLDLQFSEIRLHQIEDSKSGRSFHVYKLDTLFFNSQRDY